MLLKLSYKNIWRNRVRSLVLITSIALGMWAGVFVMGFYNGIIEQRIDNVIEKEVSHFQFHVAEYKEDNLVKYYIPDGLELIEEIRKDEQVSAIAGRLISMGMIGSARTSSGIKINGIIPEDEALVIHINDNIVEGNYFEEPKRNPILISTKTAEKLNVKLRSKVVLTFQDLHGNITSGAFRVVGLYKSTNGMYDELNVFVKQNDLRKLIGSEAEVHEIAVKLKEHEYLTSSLDKYKSEHPDLLIESWMQLSPGMEYMVDSMDSVLYIILWIIMLALLFGIVNTMLMAVLERTREIGMLMAIGMNRLRVFGMVMLETTFIMLIGGPLGIFLAYSTVTYFGHVGIDLGIIGQAMEQMGYATVIYPTLESEHYYNVIFQVVIVAIIGSLYPAKKALKLNPIEAIRKI
ncbi:MAG: FtsX-like permease family protein [Cyclobacteriaceae bacterium]|nr:FtsX-like permease family protein [Cyclobacteriaceae bacterium]